MVKSWCERCTFSLNAQTKSLQWRKSYGTNDLSFESLDKSLLESGIAFDRGVDKNGSKIVILNIRLYKKDPARSQALQRMMVFSLEQHFWHVKDQKVVMFFDMSDTGIGNMDLEMVKFIIQLFGHHFPDTLAYLLVYKLPWILNAAWTIIKSWLSEAAVSKIKFVNESSITTFIDTNNLLVRYGGTDTWKFEYKPELYMKYLSMEDEESVDGDGEGESEKDGDDEGVVDDSEDLLEPVNDHFDSLVNDSITLDPDVSGQDMDALASKKQVRFDDSSYQGPSHRLRFSGDANSSMRRRQVEKILTMQGAVPQRTQSAGPLLTSHSSVEESLDSESRMLELNPSRELVFSRSSGGERRCTLTITNQHSTAITYKIKTTAPSRYRVRPNINSLEASQSIRIIILLTDQEVLKAPVSSDKFLIQAYALAEKVKDLTALWKNMPANAVQESVLFCRLDEAPGKPTSKKQSSVKAVSDSKTHHSAGSKPVSSEPKSTPVVSEEGGTGRSKTKLTPAPHEVETRTLEQQVSKLLLICQQLQVSVVRAQRIAMATLACMMVLFIYIILYLQ
jgi:hypothetical protein